MQAGQRQIASGTSHELLTFATFADKCIPNLLKIHKVRGNNAAITLMPTPKFSGACQPSVHHQNCPIRGMHSIFMLKQAVCGETERSRSTSWRNVRLWRSRKSQH